MNCKKVISVLNPINKIIGLFKYILEIKSSLEKPKKKNRKSKKENSAEDKLAFQEKPIPVDL